MDQEPQIFELLQFAYSKSGNAPQMARQAMESGLMSFLCDNLLPDENIEFLYPGNLGYFQRYDFENEFGWICKTDSRILFHTEKLVRAPMPSFAKSFDLSQVTDWKMVPALLSNDEVHVRLREHDRSFQFRSMRQFRPVAARVGERVREQCALEKTIAIEALLLPLIPFALILFANLRFGLPMTWTIVTMLTYGVIYFAFVWRPAFK